MEFVRWRSLARSIAAGGRLYSISKYRNPDLAELSVAMKISADYAASEILNCVREIRPDYVMVGPEEPIAAGVTDELSAEAVCVCAPSQMAARIESDKGFMREFLAAHLPELNVPYRIVAGEGELRECFSRPPWPELVVKPTGLAGGKGARVQGVNFQELAEVQPYAERCLAVPGGRVLLEERVYGIEFTLHCVTDGSHVSFFPATFDYSYRNSGDTGPHTGGMGCYSAPERTLPFLPKAEYEIACYVLRCTLVALEREGMSYVGVLQGQFFLTQEGLKICEFASRFGDPEAVSLMRTLPCSWVETMAALEVRALGDGFFPHTGEASVVVCVAPSEYPSHPGAGRLFSVDREGLQAAGASFLAGACERGDHEYRTCGGRAGAIAADGPTIETGRTRVLQGLSFVSGLDYRSDIASEDDIAARRRLLN